MHTTLNVQVTEEDIKNGNRGDATGCAAYLAVKRAMLNRGWSLGLNMDICVYGDVHLLIKDECGSIVKGILISPHSDKMHDFAHSFDRRRVKPTEFLIFFE